MHNFKRNFITGLFTILPLFLTFLVLWWATNFIYRRLRYIPQLIFPNNKLAIVGFVIIIFFLIIISISYLGLFVSHYIGKKILKKTDNILVKIPIISKIYLAIKQLIEAFSFENRKAFQKVVLVEFPWKGILSVGFVMGEYHIKSKGTFLKIFICTVPNPTTGFFILAKKNQVIKTNISVEDGFKFVVSGGLVAPRNS